MNRYIKVENNIITEYTLEEFLASHVGANICDIFTGEISEKLLSNYNVYPVIPCAKRVDEEDGYIIEEGVPKFVDGKWIQNWEKRKLNT